MTYPASDVVTTNLDAAGDSPAAARTDLLDLATKFNQLRNHVSTFMQGVFTSASASAARSTLGAAASGANADITSLSSPALGTPASGNLANCTFPALNQSTTGSAASATTDNQHLGVGQAWTSYVQSTVGTGRLTATNYTNSGVKPIQVLVSCSTSGGTATVGGVVVAYASGGSVQPMSFIVPPGAVYRVDSAIWTWVELR